SMSVRASTPEHCAKRTKQDRHVHQHGPVVDVVQVEANRLLPVKIGTAADLPQTGKARTHAQALVRVVVVPSHLFSEGRAWSDERHVTAHDVPQLRQLVDGEAT